MNALFKHMYKNDIAGFIAELSSGADVNFRNDMMRTPLIECAIDNKLDLAKCLLDFGANVDAQDSLGNSSLHYACQENHLDMIVLLIERGAQLNIVDKHGNTPLWRAVFSSKGRGGAITLLLRAGADRYHKNIHGSTPLQAAESIANYNVLQYFNDADVG